MQAQAAENNAIGMVKIGFSNVERHGLLAPYQLPGERELDTLKSLGMLNSVSKEMLFHMDPDIICKKICPTRHGCSGVTNCDYAYGAPR